MRVNLLGKDNAHGLTRDRDLLSELFERAGHEVRRVDYFEMAPVAEVNVHVDLVSSHNDRRAGVNVNIPNLERKAPSTRWLEQTAHHAIWTKSRAAHDVLRSIGIAATYTGFFSADIRDRSIKKEPFALHLRGGAWQRGTDALFDVYRTRTGLPPLVVVSCEPLKNVPPGVIVYVRTMPEVEIRSLLNRARFCFWPAEVEGWGHGIVEALLCEAVVITTDADPMNVHVRPEFGELVPGRVERADLVDLCHVDRAKLGDAIKSVTSMRDEDLARRGVIGRAHALERNRAGRAAILRALDEVTR